MILLCVLKDRFKRDGLTFADEAAKLANCYRILVDRVSDIAVSELESFMHHLAKRTSLARMTTDTYSSCFQLFETINGRGKPLGVWDIVKSVVLQKAPRSKQDELHHRWEAVVALFSHYKDDWKLLFQDYCEDLMVVAAAKSDAIISHFKGSCAAPEHRRGR